MPTTENLPIAPLGPQPILREAVTQSLRAAIIAGSLEEGRLYSAPSLAKAFGVSATPVREAMMDLTREGLIETVKNKGFRIARMTDRGIDEISEIRLLIEPPIAAAVAGKFPAAILSGLSSLADRALESAEAGDLPGFLMADSDFHAGILGGHGNEELVKLAAALRTRTRLYDIKSLRDSNRLIDHAREHHRIVELLSAGDGQAAESLMRRHIARVSHAEGSPTGASGTTMP